jgi:hypothetical protein
LLLGRGLYRGRVVLAGEHRNRMQSANGLIPCSLPLQRLIGIYSSGYFNDAILTCPRTFWDGPAYGFRGRSGRPTTTVSL